MSAMRVPSGSVRFVECVSFCLNWFGSVDHLLLLLASDTRFSSVRCDSIRFWVGSVPLRCFACLRSCTYMDGLGSVSWTRPPSYVFSSPFLPHYLISLFPSLPHLAGLLPLLRFFLR